MREFGQAKVCLWKRFTLEKKSCLMHPYAAFTKNIQKLYVPMFVYDWNENEDEDTSMIEDSCNFVSAVDILGVFPMILVVWYLSTAANSMCV
jgi:hypothetical protein